MTNNQTKRLMEYIKRTGEKVVVLDAESDALFVMLPLDEYEELAGEGGGNSDFDLNGNDDLDFNSWAGGEDAPNLASDSDADLFAKKEKEEAENINDFENFATVPSAVSSAKVEPNQIPEPQIMPLESQNNAVLSQETLSDVPHEEEEEKFYLEPIE